MLFGNGIYGAACYEQCKHSEVRRALRSTIRVRLTFYRTLEHPIYRLPLATTWKDNLVQASRHRSSFPIVTTLAVRVAYY